MAGIRIQDGIRCRGCSFCYISDHGSGRCTCRMGFEQIKVQRIGQGSRKIAYAVEVEGELQVETQSPAEVREKAKVKAIAEACKSSQYQPEPSRLDSFYRAMGWFLDTTEFETALVMKRLNVFVRPVWLDDSAEAWMKKELVNAWGFTDGLNEFATKAVRWRQITSESRNSYIRQSLGVIYAAINLYELQPEGIFFPATFKMHIFGSWGIRHRSP
jgi:hypothetical protein